MDDSKDMEDSEDIVEKLLKNDDASDIRFFEEYYKNSQDSEPMEESESESELESDSDSDSDSDSKLKKLTLKRTVSAKEPEDSFIRSITIQLHLMTLPSEDLEAFLTTTKKKTDAVIIEEFNKHLKEAIQNATMPKDIAAIPLKWTIDDDGIKKKNDGSTTKDYIVRTCHLGTFLSAIADEIVTWSKTPETPVIPCGFIIVDLLNVFRQVVKRYFNDIYNESADAAIYSRVLNIILDNIDNIDSRKENKIILCIQNHLFHNKAFIQFVKELKASIKVNSILILPGHNRSSGDDVLGLMAYVLLKIIYDKCSTELITFDGYTDFTSAYFAQKEFLNKFQNYINVWEMREGERREWKREMREREMRKREMREREMREREREGRVGAMIRHPVTRASTRNADYSPYGRGGGTNKNKKLLLNKYSKKIKYTRKLKKLHKKRILSKKVVKKYSKNYKKKTLKRKNKKENINK
jgi:hypothetical protein